MKINFHPSTYFSHFLCLHECAELKPVMNTAPPSQVPRINAPARCRTYAMPPTQTRASHLPTPCNTQCAVPRLSNGTAQPPRHTRHIPRPRTFGSASLRTCLNGVPSLRHARTHIRTLSPPPARADNVPSRVRALGFRNTIAPRWVAEPRLMSSAVPCGARERGPFLQSVLPELGGRVGDLRTRDAVGAGCLGEIEAGSVL